MCAAFISLFVISGKTVITSIGIGVISLIRVRLKGQREKDKGGAAADKKLAQ